MIIKFYFQCAWVTMNNISTSSGLKSREFNNTKENAVFKTFRGATSKAMSSYTQTT